MNLQAALQEGVVALLLAAPAVSAIVGEQIFDEVPGPERQSGVAPPWIYLGPVNRQRVEIGCAPAWKFTMRFFAASVAFGRRDAWALADALTEALEGVDELPGFVVGEPFRAIQAGDAVLPSAPKTVFVDVTTTLITA